MGRPHGGESVNSRPRASGDTFPETTLETPRLVLRPYRADDAAEVALACRDELVQRWLPLPDPYTDADALAWCTEIAPGFRASGEGIEWAAVRRADDRLIGSFGLKRTDWRARTCEVGYWVAPWGRGEGLAGEAVTAIAGWLLGERGFERLVLRAAIGNEASQRVAMKVGFTREGVARNAGFTHAGRVDLVVFSLVRSDLGESVADREARRVAAFYRELPAKRVGAGALITDPRGRVLLVRPTYKESWEIPGGMVEPGESPHDAASREVGEELGVDRPIGRLLCVDWVPPRAPKTDGLMFVFDGGTVDRRQERAIALPQGELSEFRFVDPRRLEEHVEPRIARRFRASLDARDRGTTLYLVDGREPGDARG